MGESVPSIKNLNVPAEIEKHYNSECTMLKDKTGNVGAKEIHIFSFFHTTKQAENLKKFFDDFLLPNKEVFENIQKMNKLMAF
ncbi:MAG: hypothetical protein Ta2A_25140 [Treponemataceae bacterium]|nr:MAG: hypothetical protein Ta2A_25140 [Treponemataceae bacterium]